MAYNQGSLIAWRRRCHWSDQRQNVRYRRPRLEPLLAAAMHKVASLLQSEETFTLRAKIRRKNRVSEHQSWSTGS